MNGHVGKRWNRLPTLQDYDLNVIYISGRPVKAHTPLVVNAALLYIDIRYTASLEILGRIQGQRPFFA